MQGTAFRDGTRGGWRRTVDPVCQFRTGWHTIFLFTLEEERNAVLVPAGQVGAYLYEPNASVLKAGAFKQIAVRTGVKKLQVSSHLYTSDQLVADFPGRRFRVDEVLPFTGKLCKGLSKTIPQANITVRNFPLSVEELRKRTKISDGGHAYLFATTLADGKKGAGQVFQSLIR